jgi:hypothetical protein
MNNCGTRVNTHTIGAGVGNGIDISINVDDNGIMRFV